MRHMLTDNCQQELNVFKKVSGSQRETIRERFAIHCFADDKQKVVDWLQRLTAPGAKAFPTIEAMKAVAW